MTKKKETATPAIATFQHRLGGTVRRETCVCKQTPCICTPKSFKSKGKQTTQEINKDHYIGTMTTKEPEPYDHPLNDQAEDKELSSDKAPRLVSEYELLLKKLANGRNEI